MAPPKVKPVAAKVTIRAVGGEFEYEAESEIPNEVLADVLSDIADNLRGVTGDRAVDTGAWGAGR